jgi:hypothetical protein
LVVEAFEPAEALVPVLAPPLSIAGAIRVVAGVALARVEHVVAGRWIETGTPYQSEQGEETDKQTTHEAPSIE